jgi:hypothetical protein
MKITTILGLAAAAWLLSGCAALNSVSSEVSSFGEWPADRKPGTYAFERLPSQQALAAESDALEAAAAPALAQAGFVRAAPGQTPDVLVQVGSRTLLAYYRRWDERLWWSAGFGGYYGRRGWGFSPRWGVAYSSDMPRYDREVGVLLRDRASGRMLFEARATNESSRGGGEEIYAALFRAALADFPKIGINPRRVAVPLPAAMAASSPGT